MMKGSYAVGNSKSRPPQSTRTGTRGIVPLDRVRPSMRLDIAGLSENILPHAFRAL